MDEQTVLERLVNSFDDFKERLIRIEENVKGIKDIQTDVDQMKIDIAQTKESAKQAHKRLDSHEKQAMNRENEIRWLKRQITIGAIGFFAAVLSGIILYITTKHL